MSQSLDIGVRIRAAIAVVVMFSLMFSAAASGAVAANADDVLLRNNHPAGVGLFACFKKHVTQRADAERAPEAPGSSKHRHCPCCLAATGTAAVLPGRVGVATRHAPAPTRIAFLPNAPRPPQGAPSCAANGARAPPV